MPLLAKSHEIGQHFILPEINRNKYFWEQTMKKYQKAVFGQWFVSQVFQVSSDGAVIMSLILTD